MGGEIISESGGGIIPLQRGAIIPELGGGFLRNQQKATAFPRIHDQRDLIRTDFGGGANVGGID